MKKFFDSMSPEAKAVLSIILGAVIVGISCAAIAWCVHRNETLPQERRQFLDL